VWMGILLVDRSVEMLAAMKVGELADTMVECWVAYSGFLLDEY